jgi:hypothetical protein
MINAIMSGSLQDYSSRAGFQSAPVAETPVSSALQPGGSQTLEDSIQLSTTALTSLQTPEEVFKAATDGDPKAIALIEEDLSPIPHTLDLTA